MLEELKERVCRLNIELQRAGLVVMTSGNVSGREPGGDRVVIKPSGLPYEKMTPQDMVVLTLDGEVVEGRLQPSVDSATHLYLYRHRPDVNGIVHTHSNYATAFAAAGVPIPLALTAIADEFGGPIPLGEYAPVGEEEIGKEILRSIGDSRAILMKQHGVFTVGSTPEAAVKSAAVLEDVAKTCFLALQLGPATEIAPEEVARAHRRYVDKYGQSNH